jgi:hypothetical protein
MSQSVTGYTRIINYWKKEGYLEFCTGNERSLVVWGKGSFEIEGG